MGEAGTSRNARCLVDRAAPAWLSVGGVQPRTLRRLVSACLGKRDPDQNPAARPGTSPVLHKVVCLLWLTGPLTTRFCIVLLRNLNAQTVKRGIKALTITFNYYLYFLERSSSRNKILNRNEILIIHLLFLLGLCPAWVARSPQGWLMRRWAELQSWTAPVLTLSLQSAEVSYSHVQLYILLNYTRLVSGFFTVWSYMSTPHLIGALIALHAPVFFFLSPLRPVGGFVEGGGPS